MDFIERVEDSAFEMFSEFFEKAFDRVEFGRCAGQQKPCEALGVVMWGEAMGTGSVQDEKGWL